MDFLIDGPPEARASLLLAHGAGAPMDSAFMNTIAGLLAERAIRVVRFEFPYMAGRRTGGSRRPPPRAEQLMDYFSETVEGLECPGPLLIGGKSMGGRIASMIADEQYRKRTIAGLVCLGYPFHPPGKPEKLRTAHLETLVTPALICQGERDSFGTREDVAQYALSTRIEIHWSPDGNHDLAPRKASGHTGDGNLRDVAGRISDFVEGL